MMIEFACSSHAACLTREDGHTGMPAKRVVIIHLVMGQYLLVNPRKYQELARLSSQYDTIFLGEWLWWSSMESILALVGLKKGTLHRRYTSRNPIFRQWVFMPQVIVIVYPGDALQQHTEAMKWLGYIMSRHSANAQVTETGHVCLELAQNTKR